MLLVDRRVLLVRFNLSWVDDFATVKGRIDLLQFVFDALIRKLQVGQFGL